MQSVDVLCDDPTDGLGFFQSRQTDMGQVGRTRPKILVPTQRPCPKPLSFGRRLDKILMLHWFVAFGVGTFGTAIVRYAGRGGQSCPGQDGNIKAMGGAVLHEIDESLLL